MTEAQIVALGPAFAAYLGQFEPDLGQAPNRDHFRHYCRGLLADLPRKSVEPLALAAGTGVRALQEFLKTFAWDHAAVRDRLQRHLATVLAALPADPIGTVGLIDETSAVKCGRLTPGVQPQYLGCVGKRQNGLVTVHLSVAHGTFKALLDSALFLPESWADDRERCRAADIPDRLQYHPKWLLALRLIGQARRQGCACDWYTFDEGYGSKPAFLAALAQAQLRYVGEVPATLSCRLEGNPSALPARVLFAPPALRARRARTYRLTHQTEPDSYWQVKAVWVRVVGAPDARQRLLVARNRATGEVKYLVSNAGPEVSVARILAAAFTRWQVEQVFRVAKRAIGLTHYEGRSYVGLLRHLTLCAVALGFVAQQTERLRGEKPGGDLGASVSSVELVRGGVVGRMGGRNRCQSGGRTAAISPTTQCLRESRSTSAAA